MKALIEVVGVLVIEYTPDRKSVLSKSLQTICIVCKMRSHCKCKMFSLETESLLAS